ncbi:DUF3598 family protein [Pseudanabaena sp. PCC 6802]|uniref:DUF3598 family protein n=1 Tax=Pseudanabaena sp. PCC 6802 TaxID=118173 RepID=UPI00034A7543|nr:DUF3598 family protein [Pseudanabaena sp. PCC 6802]
MGTNWENFLKNLGEWQGSFVRVSLDGELLDSTPSILCLEGLENDRLVRLSLRRFGAGGYNEPPISTYEQEYRSVGKQIIFFDTGAFSKGSLQLAPFAEFGAEYGFVAENRRLRFVQLYDRQGNLNGLTLIREFRSGATARERPPLTLEQVYGRWQGIACTAYPDWKPSETYPTSLEIKEIGGDRIQQQLSFGDRTITSTARREGNKLIFEEGTLPRQILLLPDGTSSNTPLQVQLRQPFFVELGWLVEATQRQRLMRSYNEKGEWISATHIIEQKVE